MRVYHAPTSRTSSAAAAAKVDTKDFCVGDTFGSAPEADEIASRAIAERRGTMASAAHEMVATSHERSTSAGLAVLGSGGNAADAFVAAALVDDVVLPGVTSTAGLAGILVYEAKTKSLTYIHGGLADPKDADRRYREGDALAGRSVLVPGAPAAYAELVRRFGRQSLGDDVEPAAALAKNGFAIDGLYARAILGNSAKLQRSAFGRKTFFRGGQTIREGETLRIMEMADTLRAFGKDPKIFYRGAWAREAIRTINDNGGTFDAIDLSSYAPEIGTPMHARFLGHDIYAGGYGGATLMTSLTALEDLRSGHVAEPVYSAPDALELLLRIHNAVIDVAALRERGLAARGSPADIVIAQAAHSVADIVRSRNDPLPTSGDAGTHSSSVVVVDSFGNIVVGTHTIETLNWGEGLFVGGIPLSTAAPTGLDDARSANIAMRSDALSDSIVIENGLPRVALAVYGSGLHPADAQILDAVIARGLDAEAAVLEPRVGFFDFDIRKMTIDRSKHDVDPRFSSDLLCTLKQRGFMLVRASPGFPAGVVDTGFPTLVTIAPGRLQGMTPDVSYIHGVAAGD